MGLSKVLIVGATGRIGKHVTNASVKLGHPTFAFVRHTTSHDPTKAKLLKSFQDAGVTLVVGDLTNHDSLVTALKQVDVVVSAVGAGQLADQAKILDAAKEAGTIKRFVPSEFGYDYDKVEFDVGISKVLFESTQNIRRLTEKSGIPYTYVVAGLFAGTFLASILQDTQAPPRDGKLLILGDGNAKAIFNVEIDIGTFTIKAIDDPRTENKVLNIAPKENVASQNELTALWEKKIGHTFEKEYLDKAGVLKSIDEMPFPNNLVRALKYSCVVKGDQTSFPLDSKDVEATELYPDVKYTNIDEYLTRLAAT